MLLQRKISQTPPISRKIFGVDNAHGIIAFFKTSLTQVFAGVFLFCGFWMYFFNGLSKAINLFELSSIVIGL